MGIQDSLRPFPWSRSRSRKPRVDDHGSKPDRFSCDAERNVDSINSASSTPSTGEEPHLEPMWIEPKIHTALACRENLEFLKYMLPPNGATAGRVLHHAKASMTKLFTQYQPMIFKIGYTHNPEWRWTNDLYGYKFDRDMWEAMVILYQSEESGGPSMLEASLIDIYKGILVEPLGRETYHVNFLSIDGMHTIACPIYFLLNQPILYIQLL